VSATGAGPDGWSKTADLSIYRQHNHATYTKDGSFYSLKTISDATSYFQTPLTGIRSNLDHAAKFDGRTVTLGAWVYSVTSSSNVRLAYHNGTDWAYSVAYASADTWTWLEVTTTFSGITRASFGFHFSGTSSEVAYISQPMLVFGSSIGEGNYVAPVGEIVWCEQRISLYDSALASTDDIVMNVEALSNGKAPKGSISVYAATMVRNTAVTSNEGVNFGIDSYPLLSNHPMVANFYNYVSGFVGCDTNGDIERRVSEAGETIDASYFSIEGIQVSS
jgi:hypothetical protein